MRHSYRFRILPDFLKTEYLEREARFQESQRKYRAERARERRKARRALFAKPAR
jgi:hypothetical protein